VLITRRSLRVIDIVLFPFVYASAIVLRFIRKSGIGNFPLARKIFNRVGIFPIRDHYYEPLFNPKHLTRPLSVERRLPGINWNTEEQLTLLKSFTFENEFTSMPDKFVSDTVFHFRNGWFESGDAEYWYNVIRSKKPARIIEIGSGHSTKIARLAIEANHQLDQKYDCKHVCIEPYEMPWLEKLGIEVIRKRVEDIDATYFGQLEANDVLFIDSSHMIRPQGDVLFEFLEVIPTLKAGVIVHIHDIFSPRDYPRSWVVDDVLLWNEQYLLEAFLSGNREWKIIGALNFLRHNHFELLKEKCPRLSKDREPASFYIMRK
jgi:hypothetical protein